MAEPLDSDRIEILERKLEEAEAEAHRLKVTGRLMTVAVAIVALVMVLILMAPFNNVRKNPTPYVDALTERAQSRLAPEIKRTGEELYETVLPAYEEALKRLMEQRLPDVVGMVENEGREMVVLLAEDFQVKLADLREEMGARQLERLRARMPGIDDPDRIERLLLVSEAVADRIVQDLFQEHYDALTRLELAFDRVEVTEEVADMNAVQLEEHVSALVLEYIVYKLNLIREGRFEEVTPAAVHEEAALAEPDAESAS